MGSHDGGIYEAYIRQQWSRVRVFVGGKNTHIFSTGHPAGSAVERNPAGPRENPVENTKGVHGILCGIPRSHPSGSQLASCGIPLNFCNTVNAPMGSRRRSHGIPQDKKTTLVYFTRRSRLTAHGSRRAVAQSPPRRLLRGARRRRSLGTFSLHLPSQSRRGGFGRYIAEGVPRVTGCSKCRGSGRVGSGQKVFKISHGSGGVKRFSNLAGRVRSGQKFFKYHGSGQVGSRGDEKLTGRVRS